MKYTKPTVTLVSFSFNEMFCSCDPDALSYVEEALKLIGFDLSAGISNYFTQEEACTYCVPGSLVGYCKFTSSGNSNATFVFTS